MPKQLYILPFDHRSAFAEKILKKTGQLSPKEKKEISSLKDIIFRAFLKVYKNYPEKENLAILVDEEYGEKIISQAKKKNISLIIPQEKSGQKVFQFEYGERFKKHLLKYSPSYAKVLLRYNPANRNNNKAQRNRLKTFINFCRSSRIKTLIEVLVPATDKQLEKAKTRENYDLNYRPDLTKIALAELIKDNIDPDIWKIEGMERKNDWKKIVDIVDDNAESKIVVLGRGKNKKEVLNWLDTAKSQPETIGFAIGRTIFLNPLLEYKNKKINKARAIQKIADNYKFFINYWKK
jgi:myo-inositol catabolism protein IolC